MWFLWVSVAMAGPESQAVEAVLDALHTAAAEADAETYFGLYTGDAVFLGTDRTERWGIDTFRAFAAPHFAEAPAWVYTPVRRDVSMDPKGRVAWFDEDLTHAKYGEVRGSGVLVREGREWKVAQYVLSFPIPNDVAGDVVARIAAEASPMLPTPFSAEDIAAAWRPGTAITFRLTQGEAETRQRWTVVGNDGAHATTRFDTLGPDGAVVDTQEVSATFAALRDHALFPRDRTVRTLEMRDTPLGPLHCMTFAVTDAEDPTRVTRFWFSPSHPGPPVDMVVTAGGQVVSTMTQTARTAPPG